MNIVNYRLGSAEPLFLRANDPSGNIPEMTGLLVRLWIETEGQPITVIATPEADGFVIDLRQLRLGPGAYRTMVEFNDGNGWRTSREFVLNLLRRTTEVTTTPLIFSTDTDYVAILNEARNA